MKKLLYMFLFSLIFLSPIQTIAGEWEEVETPSAMVDSIPIDAERMALFDSFVVDFINEYFKKEKEFEDGDSYTQELVGLKLKRIDKIPFEKERYIVIFMVEVKRFTKETTQYTEEFLYQTVFFDINPKDVSQIGIHIFDPIDISKFLKKEI